MKRTKKRAANLAVLLLVFLHRRVKTPRVEHLLAPITLTNHSYNINAPHPNYHPSPYQQLREQIAQRLDTSLHVIVHQ